MIFLCQPSNMLWKELLVLLSFCLVVRASNEGTIDDLQRLNDTLFENYTAEFRPVFYLNQTVHVYIMYDLFSVIDFDVVSETISLSGAIELAWRDYRLRWDPQKYGGVNEMVLPASQVWYPKIVLLTGMSNIQQVGSEDFDVNISYDGIVRWTPGGVLMSSCKANMRDFPRDYQTCMLILNNMVYKKAEMTLVPLSPTVFMGFYTENGGWDVIWTNVSDKVDKYENFTSISFISITIGIIRKSEYFVITMLVPVAVLCILDAFVFLIPVGSSDRVGFSLTLFLALTVYMSVMGSFLPTTSEPLAGMTYFLLASEFHSTFVILMTIATIRLYERENMPNWLVRMYLLTVGKCRKRKQQKNSEESYENIPLDKTARESAVIEDNVTQMRESLLSSLDMFLFIFSLSTMVLMSAVFFERYLGHDHSVK